MIWESFHEREEGQTGRDLNRWFTLLALAVAFLYGAPFLAFLSRSGIPMPQAADDMGISITNKIIPVYSLGMVLFSMLLVVIATIIVSYLPARRIAHMKPTDALKGKVK